MKAIKTDVIFILGIATLVLLSGCGSRINTFGKTGKIFISRNYYELKHINLYFDSDTLDVLSRKKGKNHFLVVKNKFYEIRNSDSTYLYSLGFGLKEDTTYYNSSIYTPLSFNKDSVYNEIFANSALSFWRSLKFRLTENEVIIRSDKPKAWNMATPPKAMEWIISRKPLAKKDGT